MKGVPAGGTVGSLEEGASVVAGAGTAAGVSVVEAMVSVVVVGFFFLEKRDLSLLRDSARVNCASVSCGNGGAIKGPPAG
jgi:hypothetical protein